MRKVRGPAPRPTQSTFAIDGPGVAAGTPAIHFAAIRAERTRRSFIRGTPRGLLGSAPRCRTESGGDPESPDSGD